MDDRQHRAASARMSEIDALPADVRELVQRYGWNVVKAFIDSRVKRPARIRHLIETVLNESSATRGSYSKQGLRTEVDAPPFG